MKKSLNIYLMSVMLLVSACSEKLTPNPDLGGPLYGLTKGEPGSLEELIYNTWEFCGVYYLYDYSEYAFQTANWSGGVNRWYTPVKEENRELVRTVVNKLQNEVFAGMDGDYIRRNWFVRVFLCDSLCDNSSYDPDDLVETYLEREDMLIIPNLGETMKAYTDEDWTSWKKEFSDLLISRLYLGATVEPTDFFNSRLKKANGKDDATAIFANAWLEDPDGKYTDCVYTFRTNGYWNSSPAETVLIPEQQVDVADYISNLTTTPKAELDYTFEHFPRMLERTIDIVPYLTDVLGLDIVAMQNAACPDDPVEADYFKNLKE